MDTLAIVNRFRLIHVVNFDRLSILVLREDSVFKDIFRCFFFASDLNTNEVQCSFEHVGCSMIYG